MTELQKKFKRQATTDTTHAGDRAAIFHKEDKKAVTLNPTGTFLWESMKEPLSGEDLVKVLRDKFPELTCEQASNDVNAFLSVLTQHNLIDTI